MPEKPSQRLRLKLSNGSEFEAEGSPEFVAAERKEFISLQRAGGPESPAEAPESLQPTWETLTEIQGSTLRLRAKLRGKQAEREASLILLGAARMSLQESKPTASLLTRWLRASGYPVGRIDRVLQAALDQGEILASGSRRARRYELSGPGLAKALRLARELERFIAHGPQN